MNEKRAQKKVLRDKALFIKHVGSTSISGMKAKPIIDILAVVQELADLDQTTMNRLQINGYEHVPKDVWQERLFFRKGPWGNGSHHLHFLKANDAE